MDAFYDGRSPAESLAARRIPAPNTVLKKRFARKKRGFWTAQEKRLLRSKWGQLSLRELRKTFARHGWTGILTQATRMQLTRSKRFDNQYRGYVSRRAAAIALGICYRGMTRILRQHAEHIDLLYIYPARLRGKSHWTRHPLYLQVYFLQDIIDAFHREFRWETPSQAAQRLNLHPSTITRAIRAFGCKPNVGRGYLLSRRTYNRAIKAYRPRRRHAAT